MEEKSTSHGSPNGRDIASVTKHILENLNLAEMRAPLGNTLRELTFGRQQILHSICIQGLYLTKCSEAAVLQTRSTLEFHVGIIGVGHVGRKLLDTMLTAGYAPRQVSITSRQPDLHHSLFRQHYCDSAVELVRSRTPRVIFIACQAAHILQLAKELKGILKPSMVVCSVVAGIALSKLKQVLGTKNVLQITLSPTDMSQCELQTRITEHTKDCPIRLRNPLVALALDGVIGQTWRAFLPDEALSILKSHGYKKSKKISKAVLPESVQQVLLSLRAQTGALGLGPVDAREASCNALFNPLLVLFRKAGRKSSNVLPSQVHVALESRQSTIDSAISRVRELSIASDDDGSPRDSHVDEWVRDATIWSSELVQVLILNYERLASQLDACQ